MPRRDRPSPAALAAWRGFLSANRSVVSELDRELIDRHQLPLDWYDVLVQLHESGGEATMGELAERLLIAPSNCTRVIERMQLAQLVERRVDDHDHRVRRVRMTTTGASTLRTAAATHLAGIQHHFGTHVSDRQASELIDLFEAVRRSASDGESNRR